MGVVEKIKPASFSNLGVEYVSVYIVNSPTGTKEKKGAVISIDLNVMTKENNQAMTPGQDLEVLIIHQDVIKKSGYLTLKEKRVLCCDNNAFIEKKCTNKDHFIVDNSDPKKFVLDTVPLVANMNKTVHVEYAVPEAGLYYIMMVSCNTMNPEMHLSGVYSVKYPSGHLPDTQSGSLPFYGLMTFLFFCATLLWTMLLVRHSEDIMGVQTFIIVVLVSYFSESALRTLMLFLYNQTGINSPSVTCVVLIMSSATRTLARVLALVLCDGVGVVKDKFSSGNGFLALFAIPYFLVSAWDNFTTRFANTESPDYMKLEVAKLLVSAAADTIAYFLIYLSLMDTIDTLATSKQRVKLSVFTNLRNCIIACVFICTLVLAAFSAIIIKDTNVEILRFQWFVHDGVWTLLHFFLACVVMSLWKPSSTTSIMMDHIEISPDQAQHEDEYGMNAERLQESDEEAEGDVIVNTISDQLQPMEIMETNADKAAK